MVFRSLGEGYHPLRQKIATAGFAQKFILKNILNPVLIELSLKDILSPEMKKEIEMNECKVCPEIAKCSKCGRKICHIIHRANIHTCETELCHEEDGKKICMKCYKEG